MTPPDADPPGPCIGLEDFLKWAAIGLLWALFFIVIDTLCQS